MIQLKKTELEATLLIISSYNKDGELISGLLKENLTLGTKRKLQKIHKSVYSSYQEFLEDFKEIKKECGEDKEKMEKEFQELVSEPVKLDVEPILFSFIENIPSTNNYNFDIIDKISI